jgi:hypothetical protein
MIGRISAVAVVMAIVAVLAWQWPEIQRYLKVRQM